MCFNTHSGKVGSSLVDITHYFFCHVFEHILDRLWPFSQQQRLLHDLLPAFILALLAGGFQDIIRHITTKTHYCSNKNWLNNSSHLSVSFYHIYQKGGGPLQQETGQQVFMIRAGPPPSPPQWQQEALMFRVGLPPQYLQCLLEALKVLGFPRMSTQSLSRFYHLSDVIHSDYQNFSRCYSDWDIHLVCL